MTDTHQQTVQDLIYLVSCAVRQEKAEAKRIHDMDLDKVYKLARLHNLAAAAAFALSDGGVAHELFAQAQAKAIRKNVLMDAEWASIRAVLEKEGIWYMPLKGAVIKDLYPQFGMRQMADYDILFDARHAARLKKIMQERGFVVETFGASNHDCYHKEPIYNFEMHRALFADVHEEAFLRYYENVKDRLIQNEDASVGFHFSDEDFYVFMIAHEYKHYAGGGTGLRSLVDTYVYLRHKKLDMDYIEHEVRKLGIEEFERKNRSLALRLLEAQNYSQEDLQMLDYISSSGTYGTQEHRVQNQVRKKGSKIKYLMDRAFMPMNEVKSYHPFFYKHKVLLPALFLYRLGKALTVRRKRFAAELKTLFQIKR